MTDVDVSSYKLPVQPSPIDIAGKLGSLQQQSLAINQQKLDQANQALGYMTRAMASVGPNPPNGKADYLAVAQNAVKMGLVPQSMLNTFAERLNASPSTTAFYNELMTAAANHQEVINYHLGNFATQDTGARTNIIRLPQAIGAKPSIIASTPSEVAPGVSSLDTNPQSPTYNQQRMQGNQPPPAPTGFNNVPPGYTAPTGQVPGSTAPIVPNVVHALPVQQPNFVTQKPDVSFNQPVLNKNQDRVAGGPSGPVTGFAPGYKEAETEAGQASGQQLAKERMAAANFQRDIFPLEKAIPALENLGTKGTGPGTETINQIKSFILSNVPGVTEQDLSSVKSFDEARKYLTDFVNQTGNSGTNDKLAAAFAGNPNVHISNAAAVDVAKSAISLRRMQQARELEFEKLNLPASQFSKWAARRTNELDARAFGVDYMTPDAKKKLLVQLKKNPAEYERFNKSLQLALSSGFYKPSQPQ